MATVLRTRRSLPPRLSRRHRGPAALVVAALLLALVLGACSSDGDVATEAGQPADGPTTAALSSYGSVADLAAGLTSAGLDCTLEYEGLRDDLLPRTLSVCTVADEQLFLSVWDTDADAADFAASPEAAAAPTAVGANWTISTGTPAVAQQVADALGGEVAGDGTTAGSATP